MPQALSERQAHKELPVSLVPPELLVLPELRVPQGQPVRMVRTELRVTKVYAVPTALRAAREPRETRATKVTSVRPVPLVPWVRRVHRAVRETLVCKGHRVSPVLRVRRATVERQAASERRAIAATEDLTVLLVPPAPRVRLDLPDVTVLTEPPEPKARQVRRVKPERMEPMEPRVTKELRVLQAHKVWPELLV